MFTSSADVFRTRQAVADLLEVVHLHRMAVSRIGISGADAASLEGIVQRGGIIPEEKPRSYSSLLLAAAMPDEDFNSFVVSTAILLADRLQGGAGHDDLFWNYDAFRDHYLLADAPVRAALMNGFRVGHQTGRCVLPEEPGATACYTRASQDVLATLRSEQADDLIDFITSVPSPIEAGQLWSQKRTLTLPLADRVAFRFLYERPESLLPDEPEQVSIIPWG